MHGKGQDSIYARRVRQSFERRVKGVDADFDAGLKVKLHQQNFNVP